MHRDMDEANNAKINAEDRPENDCSVARNNHTEEIIEVMMVVCPNRVYDRIEEQVDDLVPHVVDLHETQDLLESTNKQVCDVSSG